MIQLIKSITGHAGAIYDVCVSGNFVYTTSADKFVTRWKLDEGVQDKFAIKLDQSGFRICLFNSDKFLAIGTSKGNVHILDVENRIELKNFTQHKNAVFALSINKHTNELYSADAKGFFCVWDARALELKLTQPLNCGKVRNIAVSENGKLIALSCQDGTTRILETSFYNEIITLKSHKLGANCAVFDDNILFTGGKDAYIRKWDWESEKLLKEVPAHNFAVYDLLIQDASLISASFDKTIKSWNKDDLSIQQRIERKDQGHSHTVNRLARISETEFVSVGDDKRIQVWERQDLN